MSIKTLYLILYNFLQLCGWTYFFIKVTKNLLYSKSLPLIYSETHIILEYCQYGAMLEIIHSLIGIVKSSIFATSIQIIGRSIIVLILQYFPSAISKGYLFIYFAWSIIEIVRYTYYIMSLIQKENPKFNIPYFLLWCRYSFFVVLYPIGVSGEMITVWNARKDFSKYKIIKDYNYTYADIVYPIWVLYIPALIYLYGYLFKQRKKYLNKNVMILKEKKIE